MIHMLLGTPVPQTTVGVTFGARHRSSPLGLWDRFLSHSDPQDRRRTPERFRLAPVWASTSPQDDFRTLPRHARDYIQTSGRVSSVDGSAMHMKRRHRAGSGDRENPTRAGAKCIPGLPVKTGPL